MAETLRFRLCARVSGGVRDLLYDVFYIPRQIPNRTTPGRRSFYMYIRRKSPVFRSESLMSILRRWDNTSGAMARAAALGAGSGAAATDDTTRAGLAMGDGSKSDADGATTPRISSPNSVPLTSR